MTSALLDISGDGLAVTRPKYEQVKRYLLAQLAEGKLTAGQALPTEVQFAEQLAISRTTVRQAFAELERAGVLRRVRGKGTFINEAVSHRSPPPLREGRPTGNLYGLVLPEVQHGFYPVLQDSFSDAAGDLHRQVIVCNTDQDAHRQADALLQLADRQVAGIAMVPTSRFESITPAHQVRPLQAMGIPIVFCHRGVEGIRAPLVTFSGLDVGRTAGRALLAHGHRSVAYFGTHKSAMAELYLRGLREVLAAAGVELPERHVHFGSRVGHAVAPEHEAGVRQKLEEVFAGPERPTALFTSFDSEAELIFLLLTQIGLRVPQDVSLVGVGGSLRVGAIAQRLTSVMVDEDGLARRAVGLLDEMQRGERALDDGEVSIVSLSMSDGKTLRRMGEGEAHV